MSVFAAQVAGTPLEAVALPTNVLGFGAAELSYLLARHEGAAVDRATDILAPANTERSEYVSGCGASSLFARGLIGLRDERVDVLAEAAFLEYAIAFASRWTYVRVTDSDSADMVVFFHTPRFLSVMQPRAFGSWFCSFADGKHPGTGLAAVIDAVRREHPDAEITVSTHTAADAGSEWTLELGQTSLGWRLVLAERVIDCPEALDALLAVHV